MNRLNVEKQTQVLKCLLDGSSIRSTVRITGVAKNTVSNLLVDVGKVCAEYQNKTLRNLSCKSIQCDEIWSFCYAKQKNVPKELKGKFGYEDVWTWTAICADTKLIPAWLLGNRDADTATIFIKDLASRLKNRVQLSTDGHRAYLQAVEAAFGGNIDYAQLIKVYGTVENEEVRYSPPVVKEIRSKIVEGKPDPKKISTSYVERQNLTMRMSMRRFTRLTNGFSKKIENLSHAVSLHFMYYNFCRIHKTIRVSPAMAAKVTDHLWDVEQGNRIKIS